MGYEYNAMIIKGFKIDNEAIAIFNERTNYEFEDFCIIEDACYASDYYFGICIHRVEEGYGEQLSVLRPPAKLEKYFEKACEAWNKIMLDTPGYKQLEAEDAPYYLVCQIA